MRNYIYHQLKRICLLSFFIAGWFIQAIAQGFSTESPKNGRYHETFISTYSYKDLKTIKVKSYILPIFLVSLVLLALSGLLGYVVFADASPKDSGSVLILAIGLFVAGIGGLIYCFKSIFQRRRFKIAGQKANYDYFRSKFLKFKT